VKKAPKIFLVLLLVVAGGLISVYLLKGSPSVESQIVTSGHIETTQVDLSFRLPGHVVRLLKDEGDRVRKGERVAELDPPTYLAARDRAEALVRELTARVDSLVLALSIREKVLQAHLSAAQAAVAAAQARYDRLKAGSRDEEIAEAAAARDRAKVQWQNRHDDLVRYTELFDRKIIPASRYEQARTAEEAARATYMAAEERYKLVKMGPRKETIREAKADLENRLAMLKAAQAEEKEVERLRLDLEALRAQRQAAQAALRAAEEDLRQTCLTSPLEGWGTDKDVEEGEFVQPGTPVFTVARLDPVWVRAYIPESQLGRIRLGQAARVVSDTFPEKAYPGTVTYISPEAEFTPKNVQTQEQRVKLVYRVKVTVPNPDQELKVGMPVSVVFP